MGASSDPETPPSHAQVAGRILRNVRATLDPTSEVRSLQAWPYYSVSVPSRSPYRHPKPLCVSDQVWILESLMEKPPESVPCTKQGRGWWPPFRSGLVGGPADPMEKVKADEDLTMLAVTEGGRVRRIEGLGCSEKGSDG